MVDLAGVYKVTAKGRTYYYAWRGRGAPRLHSEPGTAAFVEELAAALAARKGGDSSRLSGLCARYRASDDWRNLTDKTRKNWAPWLDRIQVKFGDLRLAQFDRPVMTGEIKRWRDTFKAHPRSADVALQVFSRLLSFAQEEGRLACNVVTPISHLYRNDRSGVIWTDEDLAALERVASKQIMWAVRLAIYTGLRQGDLLRLSTFHLRPNAIEIATGKSGGRRIAIIPLHAALKRTLAEIPRFKDVPNILTNQDGIAWKTGFGSSWQTAVKAAKIDKHFHDLRGTAATKLFLAGLTLREIATIMGWSEKGVESILDRYVKRDELLKQAARRIDMAEARTKSAKPAAKRGRKSGPAE